MKSTFKIFICIAFIFSIILNVQLCKGYEKKEIELSKIDLPEEWPLMTQKDKIKGYTDKEGVLHIYFNNSKN
jgi:hypothetical protein